GRLLVVGQPGDGDLLDAHSTTALRSDDRRPAGRFSLAASRASEWATSGAMFVVPSRLSQPHPPALPMSRGVAASSAAFTASWLPCVSRRASTSPNHIPHALAMSPGDPDFTFTPCALRPGISDAAGLVESIST